MRQLRMENQYKNKSNKLFYKNLKKSLQTPYAWVVGSTNRTTDIVVLDITQDVHLYKIVLPEEKLNVNIWIEKLKKIYALSWFKAQYTLIYISDSGQEISRETILLK